ncbi:MAG TPA: ABC transporter substrate-binding protein, partial [Burkholderiaceae bacterium]|nr:ABC transporter substrate-binding protein [Burkholderiaceae bacterium]
MRRLAAIALAAGISAASPTATLAQPDSVRIGLILPMTGPFASTGRQVEAAAKLYVAQHGNSVAGRRIELVVRDDGGTAD